MPRPPEWYYPKPRVVGWKVRWQDVPWEVQSNPGVPLPPLPGKQAAVAKAKVAISPKSPLRRECVLHRQMFEDEEPVLDFDTFATFFASPPEKQAVLDCRLEDANRTATMQAQAKANQLANELEQLAKAKATELRAATAAQLREQRRPQHGERIEYQVLRVGHQPG